MRPCRVASPALYFCLKTVGIGTDKAFLDRNPPCRKMGIYMTAEYETDIFKAKDIMGDHMCIMGDISASMLYLDTPDKVYEYSTKLIQELGPDGFILQSGCDIPANAKLENVQAMVAAATGK
jgi:uroporphyrinogen-III decarboxylase